MITTLKAAKDLNGNAGGVTVESVADILERELQHVIRTGFLVSIRSQT